MMESQVITENKEAARVGEEDVNIAVYLEFKYMEYLKAELSNMGIDARMIARVEEEAKVREESVVELESHYEYPNRQGRVHTPLPGPAIITEKGVEQGQVIGLYFSGGINGRRAGNIDMNWSGVGRVEKTVKALSIRF